MSGQHPFEHLAPPKHALARLPHEWSNTMVEWGFPAYRGKQVFHWIHRKGVWEAEQMKNLPAALKAKLSEELSFPLSVEQGYPSSDGTKKLLVRMVSEHHDPGAPKKAQALRDVETVLIPQLRDEIDDEETASSTVPVTQCISSQVGCAMGCVFCASGVAGLKRHLNAGEIVAQVLIGKRYLEDTEALRNIVFMGMGEPLHNYDSVARTLVLLSHPDGLGLSRRRVTLSTSGLIPQIDRLGKDFDGQVQLAISLHAVDDERRSSIMPVNRKYPLKDLVACLKRYPLPKRRRITIEYTLIKGVNDNVREADELVRLMSGVPIKVNIIPMNPIDESDLRAPDNASVQGFRERLFSKGVSAFIRKQRGDDISAACGQLALLGPKSGRGKRRLPVN